MGGTIHYVCLICKEEREKVIVNLFSYFYSGKYFMISKNILFNFFEIF